MTVMELPGIKHFGSIARQVAVKSALNPTLWLCFVISLPLLGFVFTTQKTGWLIVGGFVVACVPIAVAVFSCLYLLFKNPEYLRSEEYQLRMNTIRLLGDKDNQIQMGGEDVVALVTNPRLSPPTKDET